VKSDLRTKSANSIVMYTAKTIVEIGQYRSSHFNILHSSHANRPQARSATIG
jgi:hypothetical protein